MPLGTASRELSTPREYLSAVTALGCALAGGVFFAFSSFVMPALRALDAARAADAMRSINRRAVTPAFMAALFAPALACVALAIAAIASLGEPWAGWVLAGALVYLAGAIGLTVAWHVPRNDRLEAAGADAAGYWPAYAAEWTRLNHVRTASGLGAAALLLAGLQAA